MSIRFTADEILAIAEQVERNGSTFYRLAAERVASEDARALLQELSAWELQHEATFASLREALTDREREPVTYDPYDEAALYLQAVADGTVFPLNQDPAAVLGAAPTLEHVFAEALQREKDSVVFYTGMRAVVPARLGQDRVDSIIKEELGHIARLQAQRSVLVP